MEFINLIIDKRFYYWLYERNTETKTIEFDLIIEKLIVLNLNFIWSIYFGT